MLQSDGKAKGMMREIHGGGPGVQLRLAGRAAAFATVLGLCFTLSTCSAAEHPIRLGVNISGSWHNLKTDKLFYQYESWFRAASDLGVQFVDFTFMMKEALAGTTVSEAMAVAQLQALDAAMRAHGMQYVLNVEVGNWHSKMEFTRGVNAFEHHPGMAGPDGTHRWDIPMTWLLPLLNSANLKPTALIGINCDEGEHLQLHGAQWVLDKPPGAVDKPYYMVTDGMTLTGAYDALAARAAWLRAGHYQGAVRMIDEQNWPDLFHIFARAGWTVTPKLMKENFSGPVMAAAMGAALQYAAQGADLWACNDMCKWTNFPGWSPQAVRSSLLMAYWLGVSAIFVENMDFAAGPNRHPLADPTGALVDWTDPDHYTLTNYGRIVQDFYKNYAPRNPRPFDWRDYRPRVAIIRLPDGCTGPPTSWLRDRLLGMRNRPADAASSEWLKVWPLLTRGAVDARALNLNYTDVYKNPAVAPFFVPIDSVAVFDHTVHGAVLDSVRCFVVCGQALSRATFDELRRRTAEGAACIIARRLYNQYASGALPGDWLVVDDFAAPAVARKLASYAPYDNVARFRFKNHIVEFRPTADLDTLEVAIRPAGVSGVDRRYGELR